MERNPHWDETITEDIGSKGPHFNPPLGVTVPMWSPQQEWGDVGGGGEFTGWRSAEDPPSYRSDWQDYPEDEFTGIQSNVPSGGSWFKKLFDMYGGTMPGLGFDTPYRLTPEEKFIMKQQRDLQKENFKDYYYNQYKPGPWNEFDPPSPQPYPSLEQDWGEDLMALNIGDTFPLEGLGNRPGEGYGSGSWRDYGPRYEELETIPLDMQFDQWGNPIGPDDWGYFAARGGLI